MKYAVIDLEMCKVPKNFAPKGFRLKTEIIQIGTVLLDEEYQILDQRSIMVRPQYGFIDDFIEKLTAINQADVKDAPLLAEALQQLSAWLLTYGPAEEFCGVSWSNSDPHQFRQETLGKGIEDAFLTTLLEHWEDAQKTFGEIARVDHAVGLEEALIASDLEQKGRAHDGLTDAYNTAILYQKLKTEQPFRFNRIYLQAKEEETETLGYSLGDLFKGIKVDS